MSGSLFRKELEFFRPYVQGKPIEAVRREYGLSRIEKLASNENQFGPSPLALEAMREELENINFYPDGSCFELVGALAGHLNVSPDSLVIGNGGEGLLWLISMAFLNAGEEIITSEPSFDIYSMSAVFMGAKPVKTPLRGQRFDIDALIGRANDRTKILYLANPNNPTGHIASREEVDNLIKGIPEDVILVLDEAYHEFASAFPDYPENSASLPEKRPNTIVLRTFSKIYGIAGVRAGYLITSPLLAGKLNAVRQVFGVNRLAQAAAKAALKDSAYLKRIVLENRGAVAFLTEYFDRRGLEYFPSYANFVWVNTGRDSKTVFEELQRKGLIVRPGYLWGWKEWLRVSTGTPEQMAFFADKMDEVLA